MSGLLAVIDGRGIAAALPEIGAAVSALHGVRRACHVEGMSQRAAARHFGIDRKTVAKILKHALPPGYQRAKPPARPKLDAFIPIIDQILEDFL